VEVEEMLADELDFVVGVDTHRDAHTLALLACPSGIVLGQAQVQADAAGYRRALALARAQAPGRRLWALEGTGSYGAGLARFLVARGERVVEVERPARVHGRGKSDPLDAIRAARSALAKERRAEPRAGGERAGLAALLATRESAVRARAAALCQLRALIVVAPEPLRADLRGRTRAALLRRCAALTGRGEQDGLALSLRALARRAQALDREARVLERELETLVRRLAPALLAEPGVGAVSAAHLVVAWSHRGRLRGESAFARLAGAAPLPASSGKTVRHRLDRGGDRRLNRALHTIVLSRRKHDARTIAYIERRRQEGKSVREAIRSLKRYLARALFRLLERSAVTT
jgi:transposase